VRLHLHPHDHWRVTLIQPSNSKTLDSYLYTPGKRHLTNSTTAHTARARTPSSSDTMVSKILFWSGFGMRKHLPARQCEESRKMTLRY
jgi:hypothetical protein